MKYKLLYKEPLYSFQSSFWLYKANHTLVRF